MRWAAQCTEGVGDCQLRRSGKQRPSNSGGRRTPAAPPHLRTRRSGKPAGGEQAVLMQAEGLLSANRAGYGFVRTDALLDSVFLPPPEMKGLMHGDRVRIEVRSDGQGRYIGQVLGVVERGVQAFLGTLETAHRGLIVRSADQRLGLTCAATENPAAARAGDWVIARV